MQLLLNERLLLEQGDLQPCWMLSLPHWGLGLLLQQGPVTLLPGHSWGLRMLSWFGPVCRVLAAQRCSCSPAHGLLRFTESLGDSLGH